MVVAFALPTIEGWRDRIGELDIEQTTIVISAAGELLTWAISEDDTRSAVELALLLIERLGAAGILDNVPAELAELAGPDAAAISGSGVRDGDQ